MYDKKYFAVFNETRSVSFHIILAFLAFTYRLLTNYSKVIIYRLKNYVLINEIIKK